MKQSRKILIESIKRETSSGIHKWDNPTSGKSLNKTKMGSCTDTLCAAYKASVGGLANYISYTPWVENGKQKEKDGKMLTLQDKYEAQFGLPAGYLANTPTRKEDVRSFAKGLKSPTYFQTKKVRLQDGSTFLDLNNFDDLMSYYICLGSSKVADSEKDWRSHKFPKAKHYISIENESDEIKYKKNEVKSKAFAALHSKEMTDIQKRVFVDILDLGSSKNSMTTEQVNNLLFEYIDKSGYMPGSNIDKFTEIHKQLNTADGRQSLKAKHLLKTCIDNRVVYEKQGSYSWIRPQGTLIIGDNYTEALDFLMNPKKEALLEELNKAIKLKNNY